MEIIKKYWSAFVAISSVKFIVLLHQYFPKYVCCAKYGCCSLIPHFPGMLLKYFLYDFEMVPVAPIVTGYHFCFYIPHALYFYI